ncbi:hypothetical protein [Microvirga thermotolerans]|uniref:Uncharacterized protein n=1 Tax=Microvirga thermotolerans TaxID=2651334 RepID=A0A5P9JWT4_9HYPH|nr:hypothetical protein [Microvirga thermotolerans]QFU16581.1 hypothetical protein GDR74_10265 [Microvirga thermotolerans]
MDDYLARQLSSYAGRCLALSSSAPGRRTHDGNDRGIHLGASLISEAVHCAMLGITVTAADVIGNLEELPKSLLELARRLEHLEAHSFEPFEYETIALIDRIHLMGSEKVLLPESFCLDMIQEGRGLAERLVNVLRNKLHSVGDSR